ncbi:Pyridoxine 4-dehydrogenase [Onygenales sp. PD_12]|nr:Pyridoxine 4-dehydrogenase [Onygenales sp. PD_12]
MPTIVGKEVGSTGYGLMCKVSVRYCCKPAPESKYTPLLDRALEIGANFWNAGELYGTAEYNSLHMLHDYFVKHPDAADKVVLSVKGALIPGTLKPDGSEQNIRRSVDECLRVLDGTKEIDIFECARVDPAYSIEETVGVLAKLVKEGKFKSIGLSEVNAETIRRAHKVHPIAAVEVQLSMWCTDILHDGVVATCAELGIPIVAYSPLGMGALTGKITKVSDIPKGDIRNHQPWFQEDALAANKKFVDDVKLFAQKRNLSPAQVALNWVRTLGKESSMPTIIPIPGASSNERLMENMNEIAPFSAAEMKELDGMIKTNSLQGGQGGRG